MKSVLETIFDKAVSDRIATVKNKISIGKYEVEDDVNRKFIVNSDMQNISIGKRVVVQSDRIVAFAGIVENIRNYEV